MNALTPIAAPMSYGEIERLAANIAKSGLFGIRTTEQAVVLMMIAHAEGRHPVMAARDYDIINGRPAKKAEAMARDFLTGGGKIEWHALTDETADATFSHPQGGSARITWDIKRAMTAGLGSNANYKKYPRQMLRSRTVSEGVRTVWPVATSGMFVPEEAGDIPPKRDDFTGATIEADPVQESPREPAALPELKKRTLHDAIDELADEFAAAGTRAEVDTVLASDKCQKALDFARNGAKARLDAIVKAALDRTAPASDFPGDWPNVENDPNSEAALDGILERGLP